MREYKVVYAYTDYDKDIDGKLQEGCDIFEAESAQDAVDQCRQGFYSCEQMYIEEVRVWTGSGWGMALGNWI